METKLRMYILQRWNPELHAYEPYGVPAEWNIAMLGDMDKTVNCAGCGFQMKHGRSYVSLTIHNDAGLGFDVCSICHETEIERMKRAEEARVIKEIKDGQEE